MRLSDQNNSHSIIDSGGSGDCGRSGVGGRV